MCFGRLCFRLPSFFHFLFFRRHAFYPIKTMVLAHSTLSESLNSILKISTNSICPMKFGIIFASNFHQCSYLFRHRFSHRFVHPFLIKKQWFGHPFWHMLIAFGNIFRCFFGIYFCINFLMPFFRTFGSLWATLGRLFGFLIENGHQNGTHFAPGDHLLHSQGHPGLLQKRIRSPTSILDGFLMDLGWILASFLKDFGQVSAAAFAECQRRLARHEITENVNNLQKNAEICKNQTQPKTQTSKLRSRICEVQNAISCNKRRSSKQGRRCSRR